MFGFPIIKFSMHSNVENFLHLLSCPLGGFRFSSSGTFLSEIRNTGIYLNDYTKASKVEKQA